MKASLFLSFTFASIANAWVSPFGKTPAQIDTKLSMSTSSSSIGAVHGENSCFLPLEQCDNEYYAPRILQVRHRINSKNCRLFINLLNHII